MHVVGCCAWGKSPPHSFPSEQAARAARWATTISLHTMFTTITATALWALLLPLVVLLGVALWATEDRQQRARRWRRQGWSQQRIADRLGISRTSARRLLAA